MQKLPRFKGHFFNWYGTRDLRALEPAYVSSVDSGNLAGHLIALANACEEWIDALAGAEMPGAAWRTICDLAREALGALPAAGGEHGRQLAAILEEIDAPAERRRSRSKRCLPTLKRLDRKGRQSGATILPAVGTTAPPDLVVLDRGAAQGASPSTAATGSRSRRAASALNGRLKALADTAREMAHGDGFRLPARPRAQAAVDRLFASPTTARPQLLRPARLRSAARQPVRHRQGRCPDPALVPPRPRGDAARQRLGADLLVGLDVRVPDAVAGDARAGRQPARADQSPGGASGSRPTAASLGIPWGISESAYNARDLEFTYQYSNFGVPGLGLKRGLAENVVIAPYATGLAAMVDPHGARRNYARLAEMGAQGRYGFYEALDFTRSRLPEGEDVAIVRNFMAHHQGMTIVAIANTLQDGRMRARFHREPMIQASELLLQERMPRDVAVAHPRAEEVKASASGAGIEAPTVRRLTASAVGAPDHASAVERPLCGDADRCRARATAAGATSP